jgi:ribosomal protein L37AE/L43A
MKIINEYVENEKHLKLEEEEGRLKQKRKYNAEYRKKNAEKIKKKQAEKYTCDYCGAIIARSSKHLHDKSILHLSKGKYIPRTYLNLRGEIPPPLREMMERVNREKDEYDDKIMNEILEMRIKPFSRKECSPAFINILERHSYFFKEDY